MDTLGVAPRKNAAVLVHLVNAVVQGCVDLLVAWQVKFSQPYETLNTVKHIASSYISNNSIIDYSVHYLIG